MMTRRGAQTRTKRSHRQARTRVAALAASLAIVTSCGTADPDAYTWTLVSQEPIIAMDATTGVYVEGHIGILGGKIESRGLIDYRYARELEDGGYRQELVSSVYERIPAAWEPVYPGADVVTIYQDAQPDGVDARIEIYECELPEEWTVGRCVMPDGADMDDAMHRVEIHVPPGAVIESFSASSESDATVDGQKRDHR